MNDTTKWVKPYASVVGTKQMFLCINMVTLLIVMISINGCTAKKTGLLISAEHSVYKGKSVLILNPLSKSESSSGLLARTLREVIQYTVVEDPVNFINRQFPEYDSVEMFMSAFVGGRIKLDKHGIGLVILIEDLTFDHDHRVSRNRSEDLKHCWPYCALWDTNNLEVIDDQGYKITVKPPGRMDVLIVRYNRYTFSSSASAFFKVFDVESMAVISHGRTPKFRGKAITNFLISAVLTDVSRKSHLRLHYNAPNSPRKVNSTEPFDKLQYRAADEDALQKLISYVASIP